MIDEVTAIGSKFEKELRSMRDWGRLETLTDLVGRRDEWYVDHVGHVSGRNILLHIREDIDRDAFLDFVFLIDGWNLFDTIMDNDDGYDNCTEQQYQGRIRLIARLKDIGVWDDLLDIHRPATFEKEFRL